MLLALKTKVALVALLATPVAVTLGGAQLPSPRLDPIAVVAIQAGAFPYRWAGDFARNGRPVNAPRTEITVAGPIAMMKTQVSAADYDRCVADEACEPRAARGAGRADLPAVGVSWRDATAYAIWLSARSGRTWRLPTDAEWAYAAGARFHDDAVLADDGTDAFSRRWLAKYDQESNRQAATDKAVRPFGSFGENERGLSDLAGNVWEWTDTCFERQALDGAGQPTGARTVNCGVRVVEGEHRSYVTDFIRDARAGGCAVGIPPANLGFRLVRDESSGPRAWVTRIRNLLTRRTA